MRTALGILAGLIAGVVVFAVTGGVLVSGGDPDAVLGEMLDALPAAVTAGVLTFVAIVTWVLIAARRRKRRQARSDMGPPGT